MFNVNTSKKLQGFLFHFFSSKGGDSGKKYANSAFISYYSQIFFTLFTPITQKRTKLSERKNTEQKIPI